MIKRKHSKIGASSSSRWIKCPGSVQASEDICTDTTLAAAKGTVGHNISEGILKTWIKEGILSTPISASKFVGEIFNVPVNDEDPSRGNYDIEVDDESAVAIDDYVEDVIELVRSTKTGIWEPIVLIEQPFHLKDVDEQLYGTSDLVVINKFYRHIYVIDLKMGSFLVDVEDNSQLMIYALGAYFSLPAHLRRYVESLTLCIHQPKVEHRDGPFRDWHISVGKLMEFRQFIYQKIQDTRVPNPTFKTGAHCKFCPVAPCSLMRSEMEQLAITTFSSTNTHDLPKIGFMSDEQIGIVLAKKKILINWLEELQAYADRKAKDGVSYPHCKTVSKRSNRVWAENEVDTSRKLLQQLPYINANDVYAKKFKSPNQIENLLKDKGVRPKDAKSYVNNFTVVVEGQPTIVSKEHDVRKELVTSVDPTKVFSKLPSAYDTRR